MLCLDLLKFESRTSNITFSLHRGEGLNLPPLLNQRASSWDVEEHLGKQPNTILPSDHKPFGEVCSLTLRATPNICKAIPAGSGFEQPVQTFGPASKAVLIKASLVAMT